VARILSPIPILIAVGLLRFWLRLRVAGTREIRARYREIVGRDRTPLLVCANHLTMIDSVLIGWALAGPWWYLRHFRTLPWNLPEQTNFATNPLHRVLIYIFKCLPIRRGGSRTEVAETLQRFAHILASGDVGLIFPEGGRSRSGRVEVESAAWGVGRVVKSVPSCRVLCVYLRGDAQTEYSDLPSSGDTLRVSLALLEPKSDHSGLRGSRDVARQIVSRLSEMEREYFDAR
jgi:hypothetical protein